MTQPNEIIYDLVIENLPNYPVRIYIKFNSNRTPKIIAAKHAITHQIVRPPQISNPRVITAVKLLKWAANNDPDRPNPDILAFLNTI